MSYFDSPISRCEAAHTMVLTDQTQENCAHEHECPPGRICPLAGYFANIHLAERNPQNDRRPSWMSPLRIH